MMATTTTTNRIDTQEATTHCGTAGHHDKVNQTTCQYGPKFPTSDTCWKSKETTFTYITRRGRPQTDGQELKIKEKNKELKINPMIPEGERKQI